MSVRGTFVHLKNRTIPANKVTLVFGMMTVVGALMIAAVPWWWAKNIGVMLVWFGAYQLGRIGPQ